MSKNRLLLVSLLVSSSLIANFAVAQSPRNSLDNFSNKPVVTVGGFINASSAFRDREDSFKDDRLPNAARDSNLVIDSAYPGTQNAYGNDVDFANDSEIHIKVGGINEFGMKYGAVVELEADVSTDGRDEGFNSDKSYIFTEARLGRFEFGNNVGANQKMKVGPSTFARAAGGINGKYLEYINPSMLADSTHSADIQQIGTCNGFRVSSGDQAQEFNGNNQISAGSYGDCSKVKLPRFIMIPQSPISHGGYAQGFYNREVDNNYDRTTASESFGFNKGSDGSFGQLEDATKISFYTPRVSGWQLGTSYTPDTGNSGSSSAISGNLTSDIRNVISWGANYSNSFGNLGVAMSVTGETGSYEQKSTDVPQRNDLNAYDVGVMATYFGVTIGGSYGSWGDSLMPKTGAYSCKYDENIGIADQDCDDSNTTNPAISISGYEQKVEKYDDSVYWTAGLAYQFGPIAFSATHIDSEFQDNQYSATSIGIDYRMAKGLLPYLEVTQFKFESDHARYATDSTTTVDQNLLNSNEQHIKDNEGYVVLTGILFSF